MVFINSKGTRWYLHMRNTIIGRNKLPAITYFFRKEKKDDYLDNLPIHLMIKETPSGLPIVKKI